MTESRRATATEPPLSDVDPAWLLDRASDSQDRLDSSLGSLTETLVREPSALPGWTRAHVLAHVAGNATTAAEMFEGYAQGADVSQYGGSLTRREVEIEDNATRSAAALVELVRGTGARCLAAYRAMPDWDGTLRWQGGRFPVTRGPVSRWREIEIHRIDLDLGYTPADWSAQFVDFHLARELPHLGERAPGVAVPDRSSAKLLAWLFGRGDPDLPQLPPWG